MRSWGGKRREEDDEADGTDDEGEEEEDEDITGIDEDEDEDSEIEALSSMGAFASSSRADNGGSVGGAGGGKCARSGTCFIQDNLYYWTKQFFHFRISLFCIVYFLFVSIFEIIIINIYTSYLMSEVKYHLIFFKN